MRRLLIGVLVVSAACVCRADWKGLVLSVGTGTNLSANSSTVKINGVVDSIVLELPSGASTGTVSVVATPNVGTAVTLASKEITANTLIRPRFDGTGTDGTALSSDPPWPYVAWGDSLQLQVSGANVTGKTWRAFIRYNDGR